MILLLSSADEVERSTRLVLVSLGVPKSRRFKMNSVVRVERLHGVFVVDPDISPMSAEAHVFPTCMLSACLLDVFTQFPHVSRCKTNVRIARRIIPWSKQAFVTTSTLGELTLISKAPKTFQRSIRARQNWHANYAGRKPAVLVFMLAQTKLQCFSC